jgi:glutamate/tyrosine decarboxylase-like PLP-dependent enzyme
MDWLAQSFRLPEGAGGQVVAGGAMANFVGLKVARDRALGPDARSRGLAGAPARLLCVERGARGAARTADMLGLGLEAVRTVAVDDGRRMLPKAL